MSVTTVAVCGGGVVGGGIVELLHKHAVQLKPKMGEVQVKYILVRDKSKKRDFDTYGAEITDDVKKIVSDAEVQVVIEAIGGASGAAYDVVKGALESGKHVVTANKALVAEKLSELLPLTLNGGPRLFFEACVCGGIPVINAVQNDFVGDQIRCVSGILNGTTNYILSAMEADPTAPYAAVLKGAQDAGFAEADPTADVEGLDARHKLCLLTKLAFGVHVECKDIPVQGIAAAAPVDFHYAKQLNRTVKLVGVSRVVGDRLEAYISLALVPKLHPLGQAQSCTNVACIESDNLGELSLIGPGAGRYATANSCVNDLARLIQSLQMKSFESFPAAPETAPTVSENLKYTADYESDSFYLRITGSDGLGIIRRVGEIAEKNGVSINAILQNPIVDPKKIDFAVVTDSAKFEQVKKMAAEIGAQDFAAAEPVVMTLFR